MEPAEVSTLSFIDVLLNSCIDKPSPTMSKHADVEQMRDEDSRDPMPDSTTTTILEKPVTHSFHCGDDVLVPNKDGRYYLGTIVQVSTSTDNSYEGGSGEIGCLVKFGDGTHSWAQASALKLLSAPPADDARIMCVVCKQRDGAEGGPSEAVIGCDMCGRGYHGKCHTPPVDMRINGASWNCRRCVDQRYRVAVAENRALKRAEHGRLKGSRRSQHSLFNQPCDTASTTSSTASEHGKEESHCYCGKKSDWLAQMLMCCRCSRWFHQRCVQSLRYPLYAGDKLYIFACSLCNGGAEYLRRLELRWLELAHLALYNLTAYNSRNYFDLDSVLMPYIMDNWHALQLPQKMWDTSKGERRDRILTALGIRSRFKCGREMKKRATLWGLRVRRPPPQPPYLSALAQAKEKEPLTDELVKRLAPQLRFLPPDPDPHPHRHPTSNGLQPTSSNGTSSYLSHNQNMIVPVDEHWLNLMTGKRFQNLHSTSENDSPCSSPSPTEFMNNTAGNNHSVNFDLRYDLLKMNDSRPGSPYTLEDEEEKKERLKKQKTLKLYKMDYQNGGFVKKSVPFSKQPIRRKKTEKKRNCENMVKERSPSADPEIFLKGDSSISSYDYVKPNESEVKSAEVTTTNRPLEEAADTVSTPEMPQRKLSTLSDSLTPCSFKLDVKDSEPINNYFTHTKIATMNLEVSKLSTKNIIEHSKIMSLHHMNSVEPWTNGIEHESSGDETSSRGTLDAIIPPLKDFQGKNNPFLMQNNSNARSLLASRLFRKNGVQGKLARSRISLPVNLNPVIVPQRTLKRQLSEKDLIIGPNGEVKRRKHRRPRKNIQLNQSCPLPDRTNGTQKVKPTDAKRQDFNGRRLRQRQETKYFENTRKCNKVTPPSAVKSLQLSPHKNNNVSPTDDIEMSDLKSSVHSYFGAVPRMRAGEGFTCAARRVSSGGRMQYLIEWDTHAS